MKILIWLATILFFNILNAILGDVTGFKLGYILIWIPIYFIARKLCASWERRKNRKQQARYDAILAAQRPQAEDPASACDAPAVCPKCGFHLLRNSEFCSSCGTKLT